MRAASAGALTVPPGAAASAQITTTVVRRPGEVCEVCEVCEVGPAANPLTTREQVIGSGLAGGGCDGTAHITGPTALLPNVPGQSVSLRVGNVGNVSASYTVAVTGGPLNATRQVTVAAHRSQRSPSR